MAWLVALLVVVLVGHPLAIHPAKWVAIAAGAALALCALGVLARATPILTAGVALALGEYTLALALADSPPRLAGAVVAGVAAALLLEVADFERRFRHAAFGPRVLASQLRYWAGFGAFGATVALISLGAAGALSAALRSPWSPVLALIGAVAALGAAAVALRRADSSRT